jgi:glycosyltransferase involved in cell wall biosynthesis
LKIAVWHNLPSGGGKRALFDQVHELAKRGHQFEFWCPSSANISHLPLSQFGKEHVIPWTEPSQPWFLRTYRSGAVGLRRRLKLIEEHCRSASEQIHQRQFDVLFANSCQFTAASPIGLHTRLPKLLYLQEPYRPLYEAAFRPPFSGVGVPGRSRFAPWYLRKRIQDWLETPIKKQQVNAEFEAVKSYDRVLVNSRFSRESVLRAYGVNSRVCYLGVDTDSFFPQSHVTSNYLIGLGEFNWQKNIEFAIQAVSKLPNPGMKLIWVGNASKPVGYLDQLKKLASHLNVDFEPKMMIPQEELRALLGGALAMIYSPRLEPFGYAPLEANACGVPVIAVAEGGVRETVRNEVNGLLIESEPEEMAAAICRLRDDPVLRSRLAQNGVEEVRSRWSVSESVDRLESHLQTVAKSASLATVA